MFWNIGGNSVTLQTFEAEVRSFHPKESLHEYARMAELVDALDSKSNVP